MLFRSLATDLANGAIVKARTYSWPATADRFLELYDGITGA